MNAEVLSKPKLGFGVHFATRADDKDEAHAREKILCLGENILASIDGVNDEKFDFIHVPSGESLIYLIKNWKESDHKLPEAILVSDHYLDSLNSSLFLEARHQPGFRNVIFLVFSENESIVSRNRAFKLEADDYLFEGINYNDLLFKIGFFKKLKSLGVERKDVELNPKPKIRNYYQKRAFDLIFAIVVLLLCSPLFLLIALLIKLESRGPVFYVSKRAGFGYRIFDFYKFRTMRVGADKELQSLAHLNQYKGEGSNGSFVKLKNDPRITRIGKFLRNTSLDELPQLINVLKGDMSLVGNRPLPLYEAKMLTQDDYAERFLTCSGLTGLWQVMKRGTNDLTDEERILLDKIYARKCSLLFDFKIILMTIPALVQKESV